MLNINRPILSHALCRFPVDSGPVNLKALFAESGKPGPRRVNRMIQLAVLTARRCVGPHTLPEDTAVYLSSRSAHVADSLLLLQRIRDSQPSSPVSFINTSGNMAGYYVAADLGLRGSNQSVHASELAWSQLLEMAVLGAEPGQHVLVGCAEECVWPLDEHRQRHALTADQPIEERAVFVLLGPEGAAGETRLQSLAFEVPRTEVPPYAAFPDAGLSAPAEFVQWLGQQPRSAQFVERPTGKNSGSGGSTPTSDLPLCGVISVSGTG